MNKEKFKKIILGLAFIALLLVLVIRLDIFNKDQVQSLLEEGLDQGYLAIGLMTLMMVFFVPLTWFTLMGAIFLDLRGYVYIMIAALLASIVSFFLARVFRRDMLGLIERVNGRKKRPLDLESISGQLEDYGVGYLYFIRSVPLTPYALINYISGISSLDSRDYILGTILGLVPSETINILLIKSIYHMGESMKNMLFMLAVKLIYTFFVIIYHRRKRKFA